MMRFIVLFSIFWNVTSFQAPLSGGVSSRIDTSLHMGLFGRLRKKKKVKQVPEISIGSKLPDEVQIEVLSTNEEGEVVAETKTFHDLSTGAKKSIVLGMPGAFTTVCTGEHLPGYIENANRFSQLGVDRILVLTTNDRFVNEEWGKGAGILSGKSSSGMITLASDGDGDVVRNLGLAGDMGFGMGVRSKRFALVVENDVVVEKLIDEGMEECSATSAKNLVDLLTPEDAVGEDDNQAAVALGGAALVVAALAANLMGGDMKSAPSSPPAARQQAAPVQRVAPSRQKQQDFSLLNDFK